MPPVARARLTIFTDLLAVAVGLMQGGDRLPLDGHGEIDSDYLRGMAELICEASGLPMDDKRSVSFLIAELAGVEIADVRP